MKKKTLVTSVCISAFSGLAYGEMVHWTELANREQPYETDRLASLVIDVTGMESWGFQGDPNNSVFEIIVGGAIPIGIEWEVNLSTLGISWAEEATLGFLNNQIVIKPGFGDAFSVTNMNYEGSLFQDIKLGADGILDIEFYETDWDDNTGAIDAFFEPGSTITLIFPAPGTLGAIGIAGMLFGRRRRRFWNAGRSTRDY